MSSKQLDSLEELGKAVGVWNEEIYNKTIEEYKG